MKSLIRYFLITHFLLFSVHVFSTDRNNEDNNVFTISIIYDNYDFKEGLKSEWGFSCLIETPDKNILFDTGARPSVFKQNFSALNLNAKNVDVVIISHDHYDHTGGLETLLEMNSDVDVYMIESYSNKTKKIVEENGGTILYEPEITEICENVYISGTLGDKLEEQTLVIDTEKGLVVITGCSHPGIVDILKHFKAELNSEIYMVFGGFHLFRTKDDKVSQIIKEMIDLGVTKCGATHCTGDDQIEMFKDAFGENYLPMGAGRVIQF